MPRITIGLVFLVSCCGVQPCIRLWDSYGRRLAEVRTTTDGLEPFTFGPRSVHGGCDNRSYALYELERANGITEVIESKRIEPVFYVNDDPVVRAALEARTTKSH
jgi:hypothetical protein